MCECIHIARRQANAVGRNSQTVREFLEKNYLDNMDTDATVRLAIKSLLEVRKRYANMRISTKDKRAFTDMVCHEFMSEVSQVVQSGAKNIEVAVMERGKNVRVRDTPTSSC